MFLKTEVPVRKFRYRLIVQKYVETYKECQVGEGLSDEKGPYFQIEKWDGDNFKILRVDGTFK